MILSTLCHADNRCKWEFDSFCVFCFFLTNDKLIANCEPILNTYGLNCRQTWSSGWYSATYIVWCILFHVSAFIQDPTGTARIKSGYSLPYLAVQAPLDSVQLDKLLLTIISSRMYARYTAFRTLWTVTVTTHFINISPHRFFSRWLLYSPLIIQVIHR